MISGSRNNTYIVRKIFYPKTDTTSASFFLSELQCPNKLFSTTAANKQNQNNYLELKKTVFIHFLMVNTNSRLETLYEKIIK